jgi:hypothetical protein
MPENTREQVIANAETIDALKEQLSLAKSTTNVILTTMRYSLSQLEEDKDNSKTENNPEKPN